MLALLALILGAVNAGARSSATRTVTVEVIGNGMVTSSPDGISCGNGNTTCYATFSDVEPDKLTATPSSGWTFSSGGWNGCASTTDSECTVGAGNVVVTVTFTPTSGVTNSTLSVTFGADDPAVAGDEGKVTSSGAGFDSIDCGTLPPAGSDCTSVVPTGSVLTLFQTPAPGGVFLGWGGSCNGQAVSCTVRLDGDRQVGADWAPAGGSTAQLSVAITGSGHVSGGGINCPSTCVANEALNSAVTLEASPGDGYVFTGWTDGCTGTSPSCTVTMGAATTVTATFAQANVLSVAISGNGTVTDGSGAINCGGGASICSANFAAGATVSLVATPADGATFTGWTGACGGNATTCTVSMTESRSVSATFNDSTFTLTVSVTGKGTITGGGISCGSGATTCTSAGHAANSTAVLTATPSAGATFTGWGGGTCTGTTPTCTVTFNAVKTVTAAFSEGTSTSALTVTSTGPGLVTGNGINCGNGATTCTASFTPGTTAVLTETPASGASFSGWGGSCTGTAATCTVSMTSAKAVSATFATAGTPGTPGTPGTLTVRVLGRGSVSTSAGACASNGGTKTCVQHFKAGASAALTAKPGVGQAFLGWSGACAGKKTICAVTLSTAQTATATFSNAPVKTATLRSLGRPTVVKTGTGYRVTLRFVTTNGGTARVRGIRAGRAVTTVAAKVAAGRVRIGPFPVPRSGLYVFETRLAGGLLKTPACLGRCGPAAPPPTFTLTREPPTVTRAGDAWSVTLHARANQIYDGRLRTFRGTRLLVNQHFLGHVGRVAFGPFLLGSGNYTLRLAGVDGYGRARSLTWLVSLGR